MGTKIRFVVAPYALFDVLSALEHTNEREYYLNYGVTKEDGELVVFAEQKYKPLDNTCVSKCAEKKEKIDECSR